MEQFIIAGGRGSGKTYQVMTDIHDAIVAGRPRILIVFPSVERMEYWHADWMARYPHLPRPDYVYTTNILRLRGSRQFDWVHVENIDLWREGMNDEKIREIIGTYVMSTGQVTYTYRPPASVKLFDDYVAPPPPPEPVRVPAGLLKRSLERLRGR